MGGPLRAAMCQPRPRCHIDERPSAINSTSMVAQHEAQCPWDHVPILLFAARTAAIGWPCSWPELAPATTRFLQVGAAWRTSGSVQGDDRGRRSLDLQCAIRSTATFALRPGARTGGAPMPECSSVHASSRSSWDSTGDCHCRRPRRAVAVGAHCVCARLRVAVSSGAGEGCTRRITILPCTKALHIRKKTARVGAIGTVRAGARACPLWGSSHTRRLARRFAPRAHHKSGGRVTSRCYAMI